MMTKSCVKIWVSKMRDDYGKYLQQALGQVKEVRDSLGKLISSECLYFLHSLVSIVFEFQTCKT